MKKIISKFLPVNKQDINIYCLMWVIFLPIFYILLNQQINYMLLNIFTLLIFTIIIIIFSVKVILNKQKFLIKKSKAFLILTLMILWMFLSSFFAFDQHAAWFGFYKNHLCEIGFVQYLFFFMIAIIAINLKKENIKYLLNFILTISCLIIIIQFIKNDYNYIFIHKNHTGFYLSITTILATWLFIFSKNIKQKIIYVGIALLHFISLSLNSSMGPIIGVISFFVLGFIYNLIYKRNIIKKFCIIFVLFITVFAFFDYCPKIKDLKTEPETTIEKLCDITIVILNKVGLISDETIKDYDIMPGSDGWDRLTMWGVSVDNMKERPLFGVGLGSWRSYNEEMQLQTPHNEFLQYGALSGIPCLVFYLSLIIYIFSRFRKNHKSMTERGFILFGALLSYLVQSIFGSVMPFTAPLFYLILGLAIKEIDLIENKIINKNV